MKKLLLLFSVLALLSCEEKKVEQENIPSEKGIKFSDQLEVTTNRSVTLLPEARGEVSGWLAFVTAQDEVQSLDEKTGSEIMSTSNSMMQIMENLRVTLPDTLRSPAVEARTSVLLTKAKILHQLSNKKNKDPEEIFDVANDLIVEFDNFKLQLNELFLKSPGDFEIELDEEFQESRSGDSLPQEMQRQQFMQQ